MDGKKVFLIIPAYNEEKRILLVLEKYSRLGKKRFEMIVSSQSDDATDIIVNDFSAKNRHVHLIKDSGRGKGSNIINGISYALRKAKDNDIIGFVDADGAVSAEELNRMANLLSKGTMDGVIGSRYLDGSDTQGIGLWRTILSRSYNKIIRSAGLDYADTQCGAKFFRAKSLKKIHGRIFEKGWVIDLNLLLEMKRNGFRVAEIPIKYRHVKNDSKVNAFTAVAVFAETVRYLMGMKP